MVDRDHDQRLIGIHRNLLSVEAPAPMVSGEHWPRVAPCQHWRHQTQAGQAGTRCNVTSAAAAAGAGVSRRAERESEI